MLSKNMVQYLVRLDDLCPTSNLAKWERFFDLFDAYNIKPIIAAIPNNRDPKLSKCGDFNPSYWDLVRSLQKNGYLIAMHGYEHLYQTDNAGMFLLNKRSEFGGLPLPEQEKKIRAAAEIFEKENVSTEMFVAPAHTFDRNTLVALSKWSNVKVISDGLLDEPYVKYGFYWIPVQLSRAVVKKRGTWTFNYHPETCPDREFQILKKFIQGHSQDFVSLSDLSYNRFTFVDTFREYYNIYTRYLRNHVKNLVYGLR
jgi:hypothetical protein